MIINLGNVLQHCYFFYYTRRNSCWSSKKLLVICMRVCASTVSVLGVKLTVQSISPSEALISVEGMDAFHSGAS